MHLRLVIEPGLAQHRVAEKAESHQADQQEDIVIGAHARLALDDLRQLRVAGLLLQRRIGEHAGIGLLLALQALRHLGAGGGHFGGNRLQVQLGTLGLIGAEQGRPEHAAQALRDGEQHDKGDDMVITLADGLHHPRDQDRPDEQRSRHRHQELAEEKVVRAHQAGGIPVNPAADADQRDRDQDHPQHALAGKQQRAQRGAQHHAHQNHAIERLQLIGLHAQHAQQTDGAITLLGHHEAHHQCAQGKAQRTRVQQPAQPDQRRLARPFHHRRQRKQQERARQGPGQPGRVEPPDIDPLHQHRAQERNRRGHEQKGDEIEPFEHMYLHPHRQLEEHHRRQAA